jgi:hypothetical protein
MQTQKNDLLLSLSACHVQRTWSVLVLSNSNNWINRPYALSFRWRKNKFSPKIVSTEWPPCCSMAYFATVAFAMKEFKSALPEGGLLGLAPGIGGRLATSLYRSMFILSNSHSSVILCNQGLALSDSNDTVFSLTKEGMSTSREVDGYIYLCY